MKNVMKYIMMKHQLSLNYIACTMNPGASRGALVSDDVGAELKIPPTQQ
jgi:hypothetical protein